MPKKEHRFYRIAVIDKIYTWYDNFGVHAKVIIGSFAAMLFAYLMVNLVDLIFFGEADW